LLSPEVAPETPEDCAEAVVDAVDGVADPTAGLLAALGALGQHLFKNRLGVDLVSARRGRVVAAQQRTQLFVVVLFVLDDVFENGDGVLVAQRLQLRAVVGDVAAFLDFEAAQGHADAAGAVGERVGLAAGVARVGRLISAQFHDAAMPQGGVLQLRASQVAQHLGAHRVRVAVGQGLVGVVALHFGLPVAIQGVQNLLQFRAVQCFLGHSYLLAFF
jgi:hypothetical protein